MNPVAFAIAISFKKLLFLTTSIELIGSGDDLIANELVLVDEVAVVLLESFVSKLPAVQFFFSGNGVFFACHQKSFEFELLDLTFSAV